MLPAKVSRSPRRAAGQVKAFVQPVNDSLIAIATLGGLLAFGEDLEEQPGATAIKFHVVQLVDAEQVDPAVAGDALRELPLVGGLDQLADQLRRDGVADPEPGRRRRGPQGDEQVGLARARIPDQA
jgi:hypothetical protein